MIPAEGPMRQAMWPTLGGVVGMEGRERTSNMFWRGNRWELGDWGWKMRQRGRETGFSGSS